MACKQKVKVKANAPILAYIPIRERAMTKFFTCLPKNQAHLNKGML